MASKTLAQIRTKIQLETDLQEEKFITDSELNDYIRDAIADVESNIHQLNEDYFLTKANIALTSGTSEYSLPSDIYANKIRLIQYDDGATDYTIDRIRDLKEIPDIDSNDYYKYILTNDGTNGFKIKLYPTSNETSSTNVTIWYIRKANELSSDSDTCDIPDEFYNYVYWRVKLAVYQKEGNPLTEEAQKMVLYLQQRMIETLSDRIPDDDNKVLMDLSFYKDMSTE